ncbi:MAG: serine/threonine protein kinase [Verrucomicrobiaceae bacterium]|nr:serine/threonine protein kinase [Verrucomicrobiaceae bacterium]
MSSAWGSRPEYGEFKIVGAAEGRPRLLGEGSFGKTFEAVRIDIVAGGQIEERVALKVLNPSLRINPAKRLQCLQELSALSKLRHANLIRCIKAGEDKETKEIFFAMDLCLGGDLAKLVKRFGPLPERVAAVIGLQVASGLQLVHREQHVHRDIKPTNVMLAEDLPPEITLDQLTQMLEDDPSICRVVDFGLVGTTLNAQSAAGAAPQNKFVGSPMYASPEQIREQADIDGRTDIYALGMTLWYLVQGRGPLLDERGDELKHPHDAMERHLDEEAHEKRLPPRLSPEFRSILSKMVAKRPNDRYANAKELSIALTRYLEKASQGTSSNSPVVVSREPLASLYEFDPNASNSGRSHYVARHKASGESVRLTLVEDLDTNHVRNDLDDVITKLSILAKELRRPDVPTSLLRFREIVECVDVLAFAEDAPTGPSLASVIQTRSASKRPLTFHEAEVVFRPIAETMDYLIAHGWDKISLACEQVWIKPGTQDAPLNERQLLNTPLADWEDLRVQFSGMWVPPVPGSDSSASMSSMASVMASIGVSGSSFILADTLRHPVSGFLRLIYRTLTGSDVPEIAETLPSGYIPTASLEMTSNNLIRDLLCRRKPWPSVTLILNELCANEGVSVSGTTAPPVPQPPPKTNRGSGTSMGSSRIATGSRSAGGSVSRSTRGISTTSKGLTADDSRGPSAREAREAKACEIVSVGLLRLGDFLQEVDPITWATAEFIQCSQTGVWWFFPMESRGWFEGDVNRPKFVVSPFTGNEQEVAWTNWHPGEVIPCKETGHAFVLPKELPYPEGIVPPGSNGRALSFYAPSAPPIRVEPINWIPGAKVICPTTGLPFLLPSNLPPLEAIASAQRPGWIESPYVPNAPWTLSPVDWIAGKEVVCTQTKQKLLLPQVVEQWEAEITTFDPSSREVASPYQPQQRWVVVPEDWHAGNSIKCPPSGRLAKLPAQLPALMGRVIPGKPGRILSPFTSKEVDVPITRWLPGREVVCPDKGVTFLLPPNLPIPNGTVLKDRPGIAVSPYDPSKTVKVDALHWVPGEVLTCPATGERFKLGDHLPALHAILTPGQPGLVKSPFAPEASPDSEVDFELVVPIDDWVKGKEFTCPVTNRIFALPAELEEWIMDGSWIPGLPGYVKSCFSGGGQVELTEATWKPGALVTCPVTKRRFRVPVDDKFPSLALEKAAVQYAASADPNEDETAAASALKGKHKSVTPELIAAIWKRHELDTPIKRQPKVLGTLISGEPGWVMSPLSGKKQAVPPQLWAQPDTQPISLVCAESGKRFILPTNRPTLVGSADSKRAGFVISPFAPDQPYQITPAEWVEGKLLKCPFSSHPFTLPNRLSAWIPEATLVKDKPGSVINPFSTTGEIIQIKGSDWVPSSTQTTGTRQFKLPAELPPLRALSVRAEGAEAESPYAPKSFTHVQPDQWTAGASIVCSATKRSFLLPDTLPDAVFAGTDPQVDGQQKASIKSPYGNKARIPVAADDWTEGREILCPETKRRVVLPKGLPPLTGVVQLGRPCEVKSPFGSKAWMPVSIADWIEGHEVVCQETKKRFKLPSTELPPPVAQLAKDKARSAISPFTGKVQTFDPIDWMDGAKVKDPKTSRIYLLPQGLPLCEGVLIGREPVARSPFDPKQEVRVLPRDWKPGHVLTCATTTRKFVLPSPLPELVGKPINNRLGWITDPYTDSPLQVPASDWEDNKVIASPDGRKIILGQLPPLIAILAEGKNRIRSPYDQKTEVEIKRKTDWEAGAIVKCGGRQVQMPSPLPAWLESEKKNIMPWAIATVAGVVVMGGIAWKFTSSPDNSGGKEKDDPKPIEEVVDHKGDMPTPPSEPISPRDQWLKDKTDAKAAESYLAALVEELPKTKERESNLKDQFEVRKATNKLDSDFLDLIVKSAADDARLNSLCELVLLEACKEGSALRDQSLLKYAAHLEKTRANNGKVVSAYIDALGSAHSETASRASEWLASNVSLLTKDLFDEGRSRLPIGSQAQSKLFELARSPSADKGLRETAWTQHANALRKQHNDNDLKILEVRQAYLQAAVLGNNEAANLLLDKVIAELAAGESNSGYVKDPFGDEKAPLLRIAAKDWLPGHKLREPDYLPSKLFFQLPSSVPPYIEQATFDAQNPRHLIATLDRDGTVSDPDGNLVKVPHSRWLPGFRISDSNRMIQLPTNLPLMDAEVGDRNAVIAAGLPVVKNPVSGLPFRNVGWELWKPGVELIDDVETATGTKRMKVAVMPEKVKNIDPSFPVRGPNLLPEPSGSYNAKAPLFVYKVTSPYTNKPVIVPVLDWVKGGKVPEGDLKKVGVNVTMILPEKRQIVGWISDLQTFSYLDESGKKTDVKVPSAPKGEDPISYAAKLLSSEGIPGENGLSYRVDTNIKPPLVAYNDKGRDLLTGTSFERSKLYALSKSGELKHFTITEDVDQMIKKEGQQIRETQQAEAAAAARMRENPSGSPEQNGDGKTSNDKKKSNTPSTPTTPVATTPPKPPVSDPPSPSGSLPKGGWKNGNAVSRVGSYMTVVRDNKVMTRNKLNGGPQDWANWCETASDPDRKAGVLPPGYKWTPTSDGRAVAVPIK